VYGTPTFIRPCQPARATKPPKGDGWLHEPKLDGYRLQIVKEGRLVRLHSKSGYDWTERFLDVASGLAGLPCRSAVIDAELCFQAANGAPDSRGLPAALSSRQPHELVVFAFDLLHRDGVDLRPLPLNERRRRLERLVARSDLPGLNLVECFDEGEKLLEVAERMHLEGIVSKRRAAPYRSGECRDWVKVKTQSWRAANRERWRMFEKRV
jgi:bifunctional non-homologous end joining protein LigD